MPPALPNGCRLRQVGGCHRERHRDEHCEQRPPSRRGAADRPPRKSVTAGTVKARYRSRYMLLANTEYASNSAMGTRKPGSASHSNVRSPGSTPRTAATTVPTSATVQHTSTAHGAPGNHCSTRIVLNMTGPRWIQHLPHLRISTARKGAATARLPRWRRARNRPGRVDESRGRA